MPSAPPLLAMDYVGPVIGAVVFVVVMSLVKEPGRHTVNAILVAGASGVYLSGGVGSGGGLFPAVLAPAGCLRLSALPFIRRRGGRAFLLGHRPPSLGQPDLALHAHIVVWLHDV